MEMTSLEAVGAVGKQRVWVVGVCMIMLISTYNAYMLEAFNKVV